MSDTEYRVVWQREGGRRKVRRYRFHGTARRWRDFLLSDPHGRCVHSGGFAEPPFCVWDNDGYETSEPPPWLIEPTIEVRSVGPWGDTR